MAKGFVAQIGYANCMNAGLRLNRPEDGEACSDRHLTNIVVNHPKTRSGDFLVGSCSEVWRWAWASRLLFQKLGSVANTGGRGHGFRRFIKDYLDHRCSE